MEGFIYILDNVHRYSIYLDYNCLENLMDWGAFQAQVQKKIYCLLPPNISSYNCCLLCRWCFDIQNSFSTLNFGEIFFFNLETENWLFVFHCSPVTSHAWGRKPRWYWLLQEIEVMWKWKELDMTKWLSMHAQKWIMKKKEFCENEKQHRAI